MTPVLPQRLALAATLLLVLPACSPPPEPIFDAERITGHVRTLSDDDFVGRAPATPGEELTVNYLITQLKGVGLSPGGQPRADGTRDWTQLVPLRRAEIKGLPETHVFAGDKSLQWTQGLELTIRAAQTGANNVALEKVPLVFVGYGVNAPERNWDDFKGVDLKGKVALILVNDPDFETGEGDFGGRAMTYYGRWTYKYEEMARRGAAGALVIHETEPAAYGWPTVVNSNSAPMFDVRRENPLESHVPLEGWIQRDATVELFRLAKLDFETLKTQARAREFTPVELTGVTFSTRFDVTTEQVLSSNVIGVLPGSKHEDEWVIYTAHWDHLGIGLPDAEGDAIFNGAVDNAAGVAQVIEIARAFSQGKRPQRSVAFLFTAAEEKGLLGSEYYADNPVYPLAKTVAILNTDSPRPTSPARDFTTAGDAPVTLQDALIEVGRGFDRQYSPDSRPQAGMFFRSDHFPLARRGVPAISFKSGEDLVEGGKEAGRVWMDMYERIRYHQPADQFDPLQWRSDGIAADAALLYALGRRLADSREWPEWKEGSEFKATRDETAAERR